MWNFDFGRSSDWRSSLIFPLPDSGSFADEHSFPEVPDGEAPDSAPASSSAVITHLFCQHTPHTVILQPYAEADNPNSNT